MMELLCWPWITFLNKVQELCIPMKHNISKQTIITRIPSIESFSTQACLKTSLLEIIGSKIINSILGVEKRYL